MSKRSDTFIPGFEFSAVLDPHRRRSMQRALDSVLAELGERPSIAFLGWQAATLIDTIYERAGRIVIIEPDEELLENVQRGIVAHNFGTKVTLLHEDPSTARLDQRVDLAVCTATSTWFMEGADAAILANARSHIIKKQGVTIPRRLVHLFELGSPPTEIGAISVRVPRFSRPGEPVPVLSESKHFMTTDLTLQEALPTEIDDNIIVKPLVSGTISALRLVTLVELAEGVMQVTSQSGVQSIIVPLREDVAAQAGQPVSINIRYKIGEGLSTTRFSGRALAETEAPAWEHGDHEVVRQMRDRLVAMIDTLDRIGRGSDLDKVVSYTLQTHGDVSRLTALFWTVDEEFRKPLRDIVEGFRREASAKIGQVPTDETIYELMLEVYRTKRGQTTS
ncbi:MAG: hypothetical protein H0U74_21905 [Bradymonadaceae bacterium]|nr:hypothetical protein [Lujinxingiaceae bacterium]